MKYKTSAILIAGALMGAAVLPAQADPMLDLLKVLRDKGTISSDDYSLLTNAAKAKKEMAEAEKEEMMTKVESKSSSTVTVDKKGLNFQNADKSFTANIGGRIHADYGFVDDEFFGADNTGIGDEFGDGSNFRRARIGMEGTMYTDWIYGLEINYQGSDGDTGFTDALIGYKGFDNTTIKLGRHKMPASLEELTSSNRLSTMERTMATNTFALGRFNGLSVETKGSNWTAMGGMWLGEGDGDRDNEGKDSDWGASGRFTFTPIQEKNSVIHLGASVSYLDFEKENGDFQDVRVRQRANRFADRPVQIRYNSTDSATTYGVEAATIQGPFSLQGEYFHRTLDRNEFSDADLDGWYVLGTFTLTGETRGYRGGKMRTISPRNPVGKGGFGAWELVARYDELDLWDNSAASEVGSVTSLRGTESENWTIGVNWYVNDNIRFMANYVDSDIKDASGNGNTGDIKAFTFRGQVSF